MMTKPRNLTRTLLFSLALLAFGSAIPEAAQANFSVGLWGLYNNGSEPSWAGSRNKTHVYFSVRGQSGLLEVKGHHGPEGYGTRCDVFSNRVGKVCGTFTYKGPFTWDDVEGIVIRHSGSDALWVDYVTLHEADIAYASTYETRVRWGTEENGIGYCFSTDSSDGLTPYCWKGTAYQSIYFRTP